MAYISDKQWQEGYNAGYASGYDACLNAGGMLQREFASETRSTSQNPYGLPRKKIKRRQSKKQKILNEMAGVKWRKYKKGSGRKTYFEIRAQVSRSTAYKKRVKNL